MHRRKRVAAAALAGGTAMMLLAGSALARPAITEEQLEALSRRQVIHLRVQTGCEELPTDRIEVTIPEEVVGVVPEVVPGWTIETELAETEPYDLFGVEQRERVARVRWTGGSVPIDQFQDFGIAAVFRQEGTFGFPVIQGCGTEELAWDVIPAEGEEPSDAARSAPTVSVVPEQPDVDLVALQDDAGRLRETVQELRRELEDIPIPRLRDRIAELEERVAAIEEETGIASPAP